MEEGRHGPPTNYGVVRSPQGPMLVSRKEGERLNFSSSWCHPRFGLRDRLLLSWVPALLCLSALLATTASESLPTLAYAQHARISEICSEKFYGREGTPVKGFELEKVFVAMTPGVRTPVERVHGLVEMSQTSSAECRFQEFAQRHASVKVQSYPETVLLKEEMKSSSAKSDFRVFKRFTESRGCKTNSLSSYGIAQLIQLGEYLQRCYSEKLHSFQSLPLHKEFAETVGEEVLFQSLSAVLHGLLTEKQFVRFDIRKSPANFCKRCKSQVGPCSCREHEDLHYFVEPSFYRERHILKEGLVHVQKRAFLKQHQNIPVKEIISHISRVACGDENGIRGAIQVPLREIDNLFDLSDSFNSYISSQPLFRSYAQARMRPLWEVVEAWLHPTHAPDNVSVEGKIDDFKIVSVDELMMLSFLASMSKTLDRHMAPASRFVVEMFELKSSQHLPHQPIYQLSKVDDVSLNSTSLEAGLQYNDSETGLHFKSSSLMKERSDSKESNVSLSASTTAEKLGVTRHMLSNRHRQRYVRVLYNGDVITQALPACADDQMVSLGLCSINTFLSGLRSSESGSRDEL
ncbi:uncharacterized protein LOC101864243 [Aplysia californica]|uniref:Uncharacterized protein LOC101864243 n=1 Tax=Aplysia californica TaxID=6500 RepID=A0ABM0JYU3_APLCA|nr:uncharacterized protein LOC101864243 [Aplysia californica]